MLKKLTLAALASISMSAFAQSMTTVEYQTSRPMYWNTRDNWDMSGKSDMEVRKAIESRANTALSGGDRYVLATMFDRVPSNVEHSLLWGLANAHKQAVMINDRMLAYRFPATTVTSTTASSTDTMGTTTVTTTTTTTPDWEASNMDWSGIEDSWRPMRMVMTRNVKPKDISYITALDILTSDLNDSSAGVLAGWWNNDASERQKDVIVRMLKDDAMMADAIYYPSVYTRRTYSWTTNP
jgi:hypothetical protein